jgi:hypothetical protein
MPALIKLDQPRKKGEEQAIETELKLKDFKSKQADEVRKDKEEEQGLLIKQDNTQERVKKIEQEMKEFEAG